MQAGPARTLFFIPPVRKAAGGVAVLCRMAAVLREAGRDVSLVLRERSGWRPDSEGVPELDFDRAGLTRGDVWVVPEGWVNALAPGLRAGARCLVYVQNWAYLFTGLPPGVEWRSLDVSFLAVSRPVAWFIGQSLGATAPILRPGIDLDVFSAPSAKPDTLAVAYMPRKNKALADQVRAVIRARGRFSPEWVEISGLDRQGVAQALARSHAFLATGFPEGCPLPPLEAMASGAIPAGFAGLGGWDYMRQAAPPGGASGGEPGGYVPPCPMDPVPWEGNGFFVPDNDVMGAALALENALELWQRGGEELARVRRALAATATAYGLEPQRQAVLDFWERLG
ncbi:glycosyltransferase family 1 protein [Fundidesulfovibrio terrae]|uniref:glycosyltransferase family 1 protein n=1 Tax=Fundidesulfovibrio terrae TaxID=2922866 RepID=UPI001FAE8401|nr:glycosyltransferase family 1 protein [Fundidesulfovibrio terrae]